MRCFTVSHGQFRSGRLAGRSLIITWLLAAWAGGGLTVSACREPEQVVRGPVEAVTGGHTRVVWLQDTEELRDVFGRGSRLRLAGYDSRDGRGERVILPGPAPMHKPLFTPDGERVVYSVIESDTTYIVNWDGSGHQRLAEGMGVATWRDPSDGRDWIYIGREGSGQGGGLTFPRIVRAPLDDIGAEEAVWSGGVMQMDNIQLSTDGRRASSLFPWPHAGVAHLPHGGYERIARGCWTALAPDNSYIMWTLDGAHRNLLMADTRSGDRWTINASRAEAVGGHEIYHPRWSNHPLLMVLTGPYTIRAGGNNIRGGGPEVEVHIGRFSRDRRSIEKWARVTENDHANFYPDLWVDPSARPLPVAAEPAGERAEDPEQAWPPADENLVYLWQHRDAPNRVKTADGEEWSCDPEPAGLARYGRRRDMDLRRGYFIEPAAGDFVVEEIQKTGALTFEAWLTPDGEPDERATIWALGGETGISAAFRIENGKLALLWRSADRPAGTESTPLADWGAGAGPLHLAVVLGEGRAAAYLDGAFAGQAPLPPPHSAVWGGETMYFGGTPAAETNWDGFMEGIALHKRGLSPEEIARQAAAYRALADGRPAGRIVTVRAELTEASLVPSPEDIAPYQRGLVVNEYRIVEVLDGELEAEKVLVAHWVIMDGRTLETARREVGRRYTMRIELYDDRPELEGERLSMDTDNFLLDTYYDIDS
jgi:hypothetical protein